jgi:small-conductance mechanosensitive channel
VVEINMRYTVLKNGTKKILIPNSNLFSQAVIVEAAAEQKAIP